MAFWTPFFPFGLKWKPLLRRHVMSSLKTFASNTKTMGSSFMKIICTFNIFYHFIIFEPRICEVWKGKNLCPSGVNGPFDHWQNVSVRKKREWLQTDLFLMKAFWRQIFIKWQLHVPNVWFFSKIIIANCYSLPIHWPTHFIGQHVGREFCEHGCK